LTPTYHIPTMSLHDALPILARAEADLEELQSQNNELSYFSLAKNEEAMTYFENQGINVEELERVLVDEIVGRNRANEGNDLIPLDRKSTRLNSSHVKISYAV